MHKAHSFKVDVRWTGNTGEGTSAYTSYERAHEIVGERWGAPIFVVAVLAAYRFGLTKPWYWIAIAACRTWGTDLGDMFVVMFRSVASRPTALWISTAVTAALLAAAIVFWTRRSRASGSDVVPQEG